VRTCARAHPGAPSSGAAAQVRFAACVRPVPTRLALRYHRSSTKGDCETPSRPKRYRTGKKTPGFGKKDSGNGNLYYIVVQIRDNETGLRRLVVTWTGGSRRAHIRQMCVARERGRAPQGIASTLRILAAWCEFGFEHALEGR
jgi:hypothetical protein